VLETAVVDATLQRALSGGGDFADVFVEDRSVTSATYDDGKVEELRSGRSRGAGIRVVRGDTTGFAHTTDLSADGLATAAGAAAAAAAADVVPAFFASALPANIPAASVNAMTPSARFTRASSRGSRFP
jgi:predicted Zn-dependent protease